MFWMSWAHIANGYAWDLSWGGPDSIMPVPPVAASVSSGQLVTAPSSPASIFEALELVDMGGGSGALASVIADQFMVASRAVGRREPLTRGDSSRAESRGLDSPLPPLTLGPG